MTTILTQRLKDMAIKAGADLVSIHARIDGPLATSEKNNLVGAINEVAVRIPVNIAVGIAPPANPAPNDLWIDVN